MPVPTWVSPIAQLQAKYDAEREQKAAEETAAAETASVSDVNTAIRSTDGLPKTSGDEAVFFSVPGIQDTLFRLDPRPKVTAQVGTPEPLPVIYGDAPPGQ